MRAPLSRSPALRSPIILPLQGLNAWRALETIKAQAENATRPALGALNGTSSLSEAQTAITEARQSVNDLGNVANALLANAPVEGGVFRSGKALLDAGSGSRDRAATLLTRSLDFVNNPSLDLTENSRAPQTSRPKRNRSLRRRKQARERRCASHGRWRQSCFAKGQGGGR